MLEPFYLIVDDSKWLDRFLPLGLKLVQLRIKSADEDKIRNEIARSIKLCDKAGATLIINDYWQLAIDLGANYLHLGQEDLIEADVQAIRKSGLKLGISTHSDFELANALEYQPDYVALGPIYHTKLKKMKWQPQGLEKIKIWKQQISCPLVAIGGITLERAMGVFSAGADTICVVTDVLFHENPEARVTEWLKLKIAGNTD